MSAISFDADCIVVGSGPAGVSVSFPLVQSGASVLMIDGADEEPSVAGGEVFERPWQRRLGTQLEALVPEEGISPKLQTPSARRLQEEFHKAGVVHSDAFVAIGAYARGGLSRIWGGFACEFEASDLEGWPFSVTDLRPSYKAVIERIGVSGSTTDEMADFYGHSGNILPALPVGPTAAKLLARYRAGSLGPEFGLGFARNAVLSRDRGERKACDLRKDCLWGCTRGAIYDARQDIGALQVHRQFRIANKAFASEITKTANGWAILTRDGRKFTAPRIVLAAGTFGTVALVIPTLSDAPAELRLLSCPVLAMPILVPARLGRQATAEGYSLAQLGYRLRYGEGAADYVTGAVFEISGLPASAFTARLPFGRRASTELFAAMAPALLVATGYLPGVWSDNKIRWQRRGKEISVTIRGGFDPRLALAYRRITRSLRKKWRQLGGWVLPGTSLAAAGADVHYAGPFGMGLQSAFGTTCFGELHGAPGIYIADGAGLPSMPSKFPTLTIMANADRIGRHLASVIKS